jgi:hypothetical protein
MMKNLEAYKKNKENSQKLVKLEAASEIAKILENLTGDRKK